MPRHYPPSCVLVALIGLGAFGCKKEDHPEPEEQPLLGPGEACDPAVEPVDVSAETGGETPPPVCAPGLACDPVNDSGDYVCGAAIEIRGRVFDAITGEAIVGALITALNENGEPVTDVVASDACGAYVLPVSVRRNPDGTPAESPVWTLFVGARDYQPFPAGPRPALPIDFADAMANPEGAETDGDGEDSGGETYVVEIIENAATGIALIPLGAAAGGVTVSGHIPGDGTAGTLVVAEGAAVPAPYGIADASGAFTVFNVPAGAVEVRGYRSGLELQPAAVTVGTADVGDVELTVLGNDPAGLAVVTGSANIVNAPGGSATSVVLVPASVYNEALERGPVPLGLRDPPPPEAPNVSGQFDIAAVPAGTYKVLVAFENDFLVRDPDEGIGGTAIQEIEVVAGIPLTLDESFKVTEALAIIGPGTEAPEAVEAMPSLQWADDSSEEGYELVVYDALGNLVWENDVEGVSGDDVVTVEYGGDPLVAGMYYQFRVTSWRGSTDDRLYISRTEDLRGVFFTGEAPATPVCDPDALEDTTGGSTSGG